MLVFIDGLMDVWLNAWTDVCKDVWMVWMDGVDGRYGWYGMGWDGKGQEGMQILARRAR